MALCANLCRLFTNWCSVTPEYNPFQNQQQAETTASAITTAPPNNEEDVEVVSSKKYACQKCKLKEVSEEDAERRMQRNLKKAHDDHVIKGDGSSLYYHNVEGDVKNTKPFFPMQFSISTFAEKGKRSSMQDAHFVLENEQGLLFGVCDGHNGDEVAKYVSQRIQEIFFSTLKEVNDDVYKALQLAFHTIHTEVEENDTFAFIGTTVVVSYIPKNKNQIYTLTIGDSEAFIYRQVGKTNKIIPLSCVRNWASPKDRKKFMKAHQIHSWTIDHIRANAHKWGKAQELHNRFFIHPALLYMPADCTQMTAKGEKVRQLNVSRAVEGNAFSKISSKGKITVCPIEEGDVVLAVCDGVTESTSPNFLGNKLQDTPEFKNFAKEVVVYALTRRSNDNLTAVGVKIQNGGKS